MSSTFFWDIKSFQSIFQIPILESHQLLKAIHDNDYKNSFFAYIKQIKSAWRKHLYQLFASKAKNRLFMELYKNILKLKEEPFTGHYYVLNVSSPPLWRAQ